MKRLVAITAAVLGCACGLGWAQEAKETLAVKADKVYASARSALRARQWAQAQGLFEEYVKRYASHEYVPTVYLNLAYCRRAQKDSTGYDDALEQVTKRFVGSPAWDIAFGARLDRARALKDNELYLSLMEQMMRQTTAPPWRLRQDLDWDFSRYSFHYFLLWRGWQGPDFTIRQPESPHPRPGWVVGVVEMADTPQRARRALAALGKAFNALPKELPPDWQYAHVALLNRAEMAEQAKRTFDKYVQEWGDDPRCIELWLLRISELAAAGDAASAEAAFDALLESFAGAQVLAEPLWNRVVKAYRQRSYKNLIKPAEIFLKTYTTSRNWHSAASYWVSLAGQRINQNDNSVLAPTLKMIDEIYGDQTPQRRRNSLVWKTGLLLAAGKGDQATELARELIGPDQWSAGSFDLISKHAANSEVLAKVIAAARKQYHIPTSNPASKTAPMLKDLTTRLKDDQVRHGEEIGEQMYAKYPDDAATIEGVKLLADYYFKKLLPAPRDKWAQRMIKTYPCHPLTQSVLADQITSAAAAKKYDRLAEVLETMAQRFPGLHNEQYQAMRVSCCAKLQDAKAALALAEKLYGPAASGGDLEAIRDIARQAFDPVSTEFKAQGDFWMKWAKQVAGKRAELYCLQQARQAYYLKAATWGQPAQWDEAIAASLALSKNTLDPDLRWVMAFDDVNILVEKGDMGQALELLQERLKTKRTWRDLRLRLDLPRLGSALGRAKLLREGENLARQLETACFATADGWAIELMLAKMYAAVKNPKAAEHYLQLVKAHPYPARMYSHFVAALKILRDAGASKAYKAELEAYLRRAGRVQGIVPTLLAEAGAYYAGLGDRQALVVHRRLTSQYPASKARDRMDTVLANLRAKRR